MVNKPHAPRQTNKAGKKPTSNTAALNGEDTSYIVFGNEKPGKKKAPPAEVADTKGGSGKGKGAATSNGAPAESNEFAARVRISGYPLREYANLIFAYMGEGEPPEFDLPRKDVLETDAAVIVARTEVWPCNWLQLVENSLDAVHVSFVHHAGEAINIPLGAAYILEQRRGMHVCI